MLIAIILLSIIVACLLVWTIRLEFFLLNIRKAILQLDSAVNLLGTNQEKILTLTKLKSFVQLVSKEENEIREDIKKQTPKKEKVSVGSSDSDPIDSES